MSKKIITVSIVLFAFIILLGLWFSSPLLRDYFIREDIYSSDIEVAKKYKDSSVEKKF